MAWEVLLFFGICVPESPPVEALTRYRMPLSSTKELGKHTLHYCKDANPSCRMWRSVQSPPLLYATFGSITVKSCRRRRLILGGTVCGNLKTALCSGTLEPLRDSRRRASRLSSKRRVPCRGRILSPDDVVSEQSLSEDTVGLPRAIDQVPQEPFSVVRCRRRGIYRRSLLPQ